VTSFRNVSDLSSHSQWYGSEKTGTSLAFEFDGGYSLLTSSFESAATSVSGLFTSLSDSGGFQVLQRFLVLLYLGFYSHCVPHSERCQHALAGRNTWTQIARCNTESGTLQEVSFRPGHAPSLARIHLLQKFHEPLLHLLILVVVLWV
jgi:hypothetical protein